MECLRILSIGECFCINGVEPIGFATSVSLVLTSSTLVALHCVFYVTDRYDRPHSNHYSNQ